MITDILESAFGISLFSLLSLSEGQSSSAGQSHECSGTQGMENMISHQPTVNAVLREEREIIGRASQEGEGERRLKKKTIARGVWPLIMTGMIFGS